MEGLQPDGLMVWGQTVVDGLMARSAERRRQISLACSWFQEAVAASEPAIEYLGLWIAIEVLTMPTSNIQPLRDRLLDLAGGDRSEWGRFVGRLFRRRGDLVHGGERGVTLEEVAALRSIAKLLLAAEFNLELELRISELSAARAAVV